MESGEPADTGRMRPRERDSSFIDGDGKACLWIPLEDCGLHWVTTVDAYRELQETYGPGLRFERGRPGRRGWFVAADAPDGSTLGAVANLLGKPSRGEVARCWDGNALDLRPANIEVCKTGAKRGGPRGVAS